MAKEDVKNFGLYHKIDLEKLEQQEKESEAKKDQKFSSGFVAGLGMRRTYDDNKTREQRGQ